MTKPVDLSLARAAQPLPARTCPLCGGPNDCAPAACGRFDVDCWCTRERFNPDLLARIPPARRGLACVCARCALGANGVGAASSANASSDTRTSSG